MTRLGAVVFAVILAVMGGGGCASVSPERGHDQVSTLIGERTGHKTRWEKGPPDDAQLADWVRSVTAQGLTRDRAVEIALVNNPSLQATYEELGISQADMVQAGLLRNPSFGLDSSASDSTTERQTRSASHWCRTSSTSWSCRCESRLRARSSRPTR